MLLQLLFADAYSACTAVYRLQGGGFHRVMAADLLTGAVVIRIPRFEGVSLSDEAAALSFIHNHSMIPVPRVLNVDTSPFNVLGAPYMIQTKVPGDKLYHIYPTSQASYISRPSQSPSLVYGFLLESLISKSTLQYGIVHAGEYVTVIPWTQRQSKASRDFIRDSQRGCAAT